MVERVAKKAILFFAIDSGMVFEYTFLVFFFLFL